MAQTGTGWEYKETRLQSFIQKGWKPDYNVQPESLAEAGFIYEGNGDQVICVCCKVKIEAWDPGDEPLQQHETGCRFVKDPDRCEGDPTVVCYSIRKTDGDVVKSAEPHYAWMGLKCRECKQNPREVLFSPCKHCVLCRQCANDVTSCPICHSPVAGRKEATI